MTGLLVSFGIANGGSLLNSQSDLTNRCASTLEANGDEASKVEKFDEALVAYSTALSLGPSSLNIILIKWVRTMLIRCSANEGLDAAPKVRVS